MATGAVRLQQQQQQQQQQQELEDSSRCDLQLTEEQEDYLQRQFTRAKNPHPSEMMLIAAETGLSEDVVKRWYTLKLENWRRDQGLNPRGGRIC